MCHEVHKSDHGMEQEDRVGLCVEVAVLKDAADCCTAALTLWYQLPVFNNADMIVRRKGDVNAGGSEPAVLHQGLLNYTWLFTERQIFVCCSDGRCPFVRVRRPYDCLLTHAGSPEGRE